MRQLALVLLGALAVVPTARTNDFVTNVSPPNGAVVSSQEAVTFQWTSTLGVHPVFPGGANLVVTSGGSAVSDMTYPCTGGGTPSCPTSATAGPFPAGSYSWYVRRWVFYEDRPAEWISSTPTSFTVADPLAPPVEPPAPSPAPQPNRPPTARYTFAPATPTAGQTIVFDGTASADEDGSIVSHAWTFGDGATATGASVRHAYAQPGTYTVTLAVTDNSGNTAQTATSLAVAAPPDVQAPSVVAIPTSGRAGTRVRLWFRTSDDSGTARVTVTVMRAARVLATLSSRFAAAKGARGSVTWPAPRSRKGRLAFCVRAFDEAGNASARSCAPLVLR